MIKRTSVSDYLSLDLFPDPCVIIRNDGTIFDINASCAGVVGADPRELAGKNYHDYEPLAMLEEKIAAAVGNNEEDFDLIHFGTRHFQIFILPFIAVDGTKLVRILLKDVSNFVTLEKELLKRNRELIIINTLSGAFISSENMDLVMEDLLGKVLLVTGHSSGWLFFREERSFKLKSSRGISPECRKGIEEGILEPLCNDVIKINEPFHNMESAAVSRIELLHNEGINFLTAVPLIYGNEPIGLLFLASRSGKGRNIDFDAASLLALVGNHVSVIIDKIRLFQETKRLSITDGLTGLYNSRYFYRQLDLEIARTNRYGGTFSLILFDIDNFKQLNDTYGHQAGDDVLHELAGILKSASRETDIVVRYGGEEFIIILPNTPVEDTVHLADRIRALVENNIFLPLHEQGPRITLSGGIAAYPMTASDAKSLLNAADAALYSAKSAGRNRIVCFRGESHAKDFQ
jgi:diguanylate cyclase (GGDEF)-like protein